MQEGYIVHGELETIRIDNDWEIIEQFSGSDIFTTPAGRGVFNLSGDTIEAIDSSPLKICRKNSGAPARKIIPILSTNLRKSVN